LPLVVGCMAQPVPTDPRVFLTPDAGVLAEPPVVVAAPMLRVSVRLVNPTGADRPVLQTVDWTNAEGLPVRSLMSRPQRLTVPRYGDATISFIAPTPAATQFRIRVEPDHSATNPN
jgi:uncharacterized protein YcfL